MTLPKSLFVGSMIFVQILCDAAEPTGTPIHIKWGLSQSPCWESEGFEVFNKTTQIPTQLKVAECKHDGHIILDELKVSDSVTHTSRKVEPPKSDAALLPGGRSNPVFEITWDGLYIFMLSIEQPEQKDFKASVHVEIKAPYGYLSAVDWPLLPVRDK